MNRSCAAAVFAIIATILCAAQSDERITYTELDITGASALSSSQIREVKDSVLGKRDTSENLMDTARHALTAAFKSECYLNPDIELFSAFRKDGPADDVTLHVTVKEGLRYSLRNFKVQWDQTIPAQQLAQQLPLDAMRRGDCQGLNDVENTVAQLYRDRGYPSAKVHALIQPSGATRQFDLTLYVDQGSRAR